jgi:hypothetical protein
MARHPFLAGFPLLGLLAPVFACSDPGLDVAQGAASLQWTTSFAGTKVPQCVPGPHWSNAPVSANDQQYVSADQVSGGVVVDGRDGALVLCRVSPRGEQFIVTGEIHSTGTDPQGNPLLTELAVSFSVAPNQPDAQGTLYITDQKSGDFAFSSDTTIIPPKPGCTFSVAPTDAHSGLGVGPGHVWASVQCPHISDWRNRNKAECKIPTGFIVLDHCLQD